MWAVGWRKCMKVLELFGRYIKISSARAHKKQYHTLAAKSFRVLSIFGQMFKSLGDIPFGSNQELMAKHNIPSFTFAEFCDELSHFDCAPHITFTTQGIFNPPHFDKNDISEYTFAVLASTKTSDGSLAEGTTGTGMSGAQFVFPVYRFYIDLKEDQLSKLTGLQSAANIVRFLESSQGASQEWVCRFKSLKLQ
ncbi:hypothetical protein PSHT_02120 [Puccinia striiformis]|nr:hypothetical protein PSHT_02120 [Puccinia striiformis]